MKKERMGLRTGLGMGLNLLLLLAMVATNLLSLYHLSSTYSSSSFSKQSAAAAGVPDNLVTQLATIRATISHLTRLNPSAKSQPQAQSQKPQQPPTDLLLYAKISPIASACHDHPELLHRYMNYTPFRPCPPLDPQDLEESLILRGCHPLPRRRCFSPTAPLKAFSALPADPFPTSLPDAAVLWSPKSPCRSFSCLKSKTPGFDMPAESTHFLPPSKSNLDLTIPQLLRLARDSSAAPIRLALDVGGGTGTFAARMKLDANTTVLTTTMNLGGPFNQAVALRGLIPLHMPLQQRFPVYDGVLDLVRCGHAVNRWIPSPSLEFLLFDADRVLRSGGLLWIDHFFCKSADLNAVYGPMFHKLNYKVLKWTVANKTDTSGMRNGEIYLTALLQKHPGK